MEPGIVILGASGLAREVFWHIRGARPAVNILFVDDSTPTHSIPIGGNVVDVVKDWHFPIGFRQFVIGVGDPQVKAVLVMRALRAGLEPGPSIVHPNALVQGEDCILGNGGVIAPGCILTTNVRLGDYVLLNLNTTVGHDSRLGNYVTCNPGCNISGNVALGEGVNLGTGTVVRENIKIATGVRTGAQACIVNDVAEPGITIVGVPGRPLPR